jgi:IS5 family transposase
MRPRRPAAQEPDGLFKTPLARFIDMDHSLVQLADRIDWEGLEEAVAGSFAEAGRPGNEARFMLGMLVLKAMNNLSDEKLWERWPCDPYFQYFTGELFFQHRVPHERSGMSHWRQRLGAKVLDALIRESLRVAHEAGALTGRDMEAVSVDTTVQEKATRFPTDAGLLYEALVRLGAQARAAGIRLRQSYVRVGKRAQIKAGRYGHAKQFKRRNRMIRFLKARLGRVIRDIERKTAPDICGDGAVRAGFAESLAKARTIHRQALVKRGVRKIYSWHAPEVECIGKGKARAPYEFGCKATITTTNGRAKGGMFVLHAAALHGNPFDGHTLGRVLAETAEMTGVTPRRVHVDKGYRGHRQGEAVFDPQTRRDVRPPWRVYISGRRKLPPAIKAELRRRAGIEPVIGHMKGDHGMDRNHLKGRHGDQVNVKMAAVGYNFTRILQWLQDFVQFLTSLWRAILGASRKTARC